MRGSGAKITWGGVGGVLRRIESGGRSASMRMACALLGADSPLPYPFQAVPIRGLVPSRATTKKQRANGLQHVKGLPRIESMQEFSFTLLDVWPFLLRCGQCFLSRFRHLSLRLCCNTSAPSPRPHQLPCRFRT